MAHNNKHIEAENGVRLMVTEQRKLPGRLEVTVARFDDQYEMLCESVNADHFNADMLKIEPRNMTALRDAIGRTITAVGQNLGARHESARPGRVIFVVATDGMENSSREFTPERLRTMINEQTNKYSWEFMFMGTSQESILQAQSYGFSPTTTYAASDTAAGIHSHYTVASASVSRARTTNTAVEVTDEDRRNLQ
jgi:hypothetical protein